MVDDIKCFGKNFVAENKTKVFLVYAACYAEFFVFVFEYPLQFSFFAAGFFALSSPFTCLLILGVMSQALVAKFGLNIFPKHFLGLGIVMLTLRIVLFSNRHFFLRYSFCAVLTGLILVHSILFSNLWVESSIRIVFAFVCLVVMYEIVRNDFDGEMNQLLKIGCSFFLHGALAYWILADGMALVPVSFFYGNPNAFGLFCGCVTIYFLSHINDSRIISFYHVGLGVFLILLSQSRTAMVGVMVVVLVILLWEILSWIVGSRFKHGPALTARLFGFGFVLALGLFVFLPNPKSAAQENDLLVELISARGALFDASIADIKSEPLVGIGWSVRRGLEPMDDFQSGQEKGNILLSFAGELGILGWLLYVGICAALIGVLVNSVFSGSVFLYLFTVNHSEYFAFSLSSMAFLFWMIALVTYFNYSTVKC